MFLRVRGAAIPGKELVEMVINTDLIGGFYKWDTSAACLYFVLRADGSGFPVDEASYRKIETAVKPV